MWLVLFVGVIFLVDAALIGGIPLMLVAAKRPKLGLLVSIIIGISVIIDGTMNFDGISYPRSYPLRFIGVPAETFPLSLVLIIVSIAACLWAAFRDTGH